MNNTGQASAAASRNGPCGIAARPPRNATLQSRRTPLGALRSARSATTSPRSTQARAASTWSNESARTGMTRTRVRLSLASAPSRSKSSLMRAACCVYMRMLTVTREPVANRRIASKLPRCDPSTSAPRRSRATRSRCSSPFTTSVIVGAPSEPESHPVHDRDAEGQKVAEHVALARRTSEYQRSVGNLVDAAQVVERGPARRRARYVEVGHDRNHQDARHALPEASIQPCTRAHRGGGAAFVALVPRVAARHAPAPNRRGSRRGGRDSMPSTSRGCVQSLRRPSRNMSKCENPSAK